VGTNKEIIVAVRINVTGTDSGRYKYIIEWISKLLLAGINGNKYPVHIAIT
jgi:hypothetical protein